jgi:hypothetical protein
MPIGDKTIISFVSPYKLKDMIIPEPNSETGGDRLSDQQKFKLRMASSTGGREQASMLLKKMYAWRGYSIDPTTEKEPNKITLVADTDGKTIGTMTLCFDSEFGLPADENFHDKLEELRAQKRKLCEPSRLAIEEDVPKRVFASLIHVSYIYAHNIYGFTDYVIEVNPRHAMFYKRMLGFHDFGEERTCTRVNAPAVLLRLELEYMAEQIQKFGGMMEQHGKEKSFYPYFFSRWDEPGITDRLTSGST